MEGTTRPEQHAQPEAGAHTIDKTPAQHTQPYQEPPDYTKDKNGGIVSDVEKGGISPASTHDNGSPAREPAEDESKWRAFYRKHRTLIKAALHIFIFCLFTGWWIASLVLHRNDMNWLVPFLLWLAISLRLLFCWIPISIITKPMHWVWNHTGSAVAEMIPEKMRLPLGAALTVGVIIIGSFVSEENADNTRENRAISLFGLIVLIFFMWLTSKHRKAINWHTVCDCIVVLEWISKSSAD